MFLYGKNSVFERLKTNPKSIKKIFLQDNFRLPDIVKLIKVNDIFLQCLPPHKLSRIKRAENLQGIIAEVDNFKYRLLEDLLSQPKNKQSTLIFLDRICDPQNLGGIIRTAACFGGFSIIIPKFKACEINETALHVASGGENYVPISMVSNLSNAIIAAKKAGYWIMGTMLNKQAEDINQISLPFPLGLVFGSEGEGIRYGLEKQLDIKARIPMKGAKLSLNVSLTCAIFCHQICEQKQKQMPN